MRRGTGECKIQYSHVVEYIITHTSAAEGSREWCVPVPVPKGWSIQWGRMDYWGHAKANRVPRLERPETAECHQWSTLQYQMILVEEEVALN